MKETILILGMDGYIGWPLSIELAKENDDKVIGIDNFTRRKCVEEVGSNSLTPIVSMGDRIKAYKKVYKKDNLIFEEGDVTDANRLNFILKKYKPSVIINYAQIPSAPYSMIDGDHAKKVTENNLLGNLNLLWGMRKHGLESLLIKMGTAGEWGQPNINIPSDGYIDIEYKGRTDNLPFPKQAGSFYHWSKVSESQHTDWCSKIWGFTAVDLMQGIVYGLPDHHKKDKRLITRFDYDECFGTVINRFMAQHLIDHPLTIYGEGKQKRGLININDAIDCIKLYINNKPKKGTYTIYNQMAECETSINQLANMFDSTINHIKNPRVEKSIHYLKIENDNLLELGFKPRNLLSEVVNTVNYLRKYKNRIKEDAIDPKIKWQDNKHTCDPCTCLDDKCCDK